MLSREQDIQTSLVRYSLSCCLLNQGALLPSAISVLVAEATSLSSFRKHFNHFLSHLLLRDNLSRPSKYATKQDCSSNSTCRNSQNSKIFLSQEDADSEVNTGVLPSSGKGGPMVCRFTARLGSTHLVIPAQEDQELKGSFSYIAEFKASSQVQ